LARVLEQGRGEGRLHFERSPEDMARMLISGLEGAMLVARPYADVERFQTIATVLLSSLTGVDAPSSP
jgi:TetR/AcrR family transcriptional regulator, transcriptional repressor for nem operon